MDYLPRFSPGSNVSFTASGNIVGGRLVTASGKYLASMAGADAKAVAGVAGFDADNGELLTVYSGGVQHLEVAGDAVHAGDVVYLAADGCISTTGTLAVGVALTDATAGKRADVDYGALIVPPEGE